MYGKTYKLHNSPALAPAEALLVSSSPAFDGLHDDIKFFILVCFYRKLLKKRRPHGEREPTISLHHFMHMPQIKESAVRILSLSINVPVMKALTGLEYVLKKAQVLHQLNSYIC